LKSFIGHQLVYVARDDLIDIGEEDIRDDKFSGIEFDLVILIQQRFFILIHEDIAEVADIAGRESQIIDGQIFDLTVKGATTPRLYRKARLAKLSPHSVRDVGSNRFRQLEYAGCRGVDDVICWNMPAVVVWMTLSAVPFFGEYLNS